MNWLFTWFMQTPGMVVRIHQGTAVFQMLDQSLVILRVNAYWDLRNVYIFQYRESMGPEILSFGEKKPNRILTDQTWLLVKKFPFLVNLLVQQGPWIGTFY